MSDFFESDAITKGYDAGISRRIFNYIRPYKALVAATALALLVGTAGELVLPIVVRSIVDRALMPSWRTVGTAAEPAPEAKDLHLAGDEPRVGGRFVIPTARIAALTARDRAALEARGLIDALDWYYCDLSTLGEPGRAVVAQRSALFLLEGRHAIILSRDLKTLTPAEARSLRSSDLALVSSLSFLLLAVLLVVLCCAFVQTFASSLIGQRIMKDLRMEIFRHASTRSLAFLSRQPVGRLVTRMTSDVETINQFFTDVIVAFLKDAALMVGVLIVLLSMDVRLALVALATLPPVLIVTLISRGKARDAFRRQRQWVSKVNSYIAERLSGISVVQLFIREEASRREFEAHDRELLGASLGEMYVFATFRPLVDLFANISVAVVLWYGASLLSLQILSLGTLIAFVNLIRMFYAPVMDISEKYTLLQSAMAGGERVFALLDETERVPDSPKVAMPSSIRGHIEFDRVSFAYKEGEWILRDLSFSVEPGEMVAIVGPTGAGKTTIANLITRLWDIQRGSIRIDGHDLRQLPLDGLRKAVQPVLQDVFLFSGSIEENIRLGDEVTVDRMRAASAAVHADEFIDRMPGGFAEVLSEGAANISQGQRQLLSFARVLAHEPSIIILDEATSSIDTETEQLVQRGLEALLAGRTSVVIAHRLSTIRHANRILVLAEGAVAESGTHEELLQLRGLYWNLYRLQYGGDVGLREAGS